MDDGSESAHTLIEAAAPIPCSTASLEVSWEQRRDGSFLTIPGTSWVDAGMEGCSSAQRRTINAVQTTPVRTEDEPATITAAIEGTIEAERTQYYVVRVTNQRCGRSWTCQKRFSDFELLESMLASMVLLYEAARLPVTEPVLHATHLNSCQSVNVAILAYRLLFLMPTPITECR